MFTMKVRFGLAVLSRLVACGVIPLALCGCAPKIKRFDASLTRVCPGATSVVRWDARAEGIDLVSDQANLAAVPNRPVSGTQPIVVTRDTTLTLTAKKGERTATEQCHVTAIGTGATTLSNFFVAPYHDLIILRVENASCTTQGDHVELTGRGKIDPAKLDPQATIAQIDEVPLGDFWAGMADAFSLSWSDFFGCKRSDIPHGPVRIRFGDTQATLDPAGPPSHAFDGKNPAGEWQLAMVFAPGEECPCKDSFDLAITLHCP